MLRFNLSVLSVFLLIVHCESVNKIGNECPNVKADLKAIRKRRHLTFPDGSNGVITISLAKAVPTHAPSGWMMTSDLDVMYPLPNPKFTKAHFRRKLHHKQKREMWDRLKNALFIHNMNGHDCVLRSICDARTHLAPPGTSLVHDMLRAIFTAPMEEDDFAEEVGGTYTELRDPNFCDRAHDCPLSLVHFILQFNKQKP